MIYEKTTDIAIIGGGAAGLAAAAECAAAGVAALVIDREELPGGILRQCIHNGFGLRYFKEELTGPEYADRVMKLAQKAGTRFCTGTTVTEAEKLEDGSFSLLLLSSREGVVRLNAKAVILAMGCRERNRGNLAIPGSRPAGVFTAGCAQKLLNMEGMIPGRSAVIVGSGDIGLIMARRLRWSGVEVKAVIEIMPYPSGLTRNVVQCLEDFNIPLYLEHAVVSINGRERVQSVDVAPLREGIAQQNQKFNISLKERIYSRIWS
jgi:NADPH-dependent 2,4-dienoyl-CoA reductase/sulfur reductase-like enzyme